MTLFNTSRKNIESVVHGNEVLRCYYDTLFARPGRGSKIFLDLSCGSRSDIRRIVEGLGHTWVGVDIIDMPDVIKADAHALPFCSDVFDIVFSAATLEHYKNPWVVAGEAQRVLRKEGYMAGLVAFLQPEHGESYFHMTHNGVRSLLSNYGFDVLDVRPGEMHGITYLIRSLFPKYLSPIGRGFSIYGDLLMVLRRVLFELGIRIVYAKNACERERLLALVRSDRLKYAASVVFLARKR